MHIVAVDGYGDEYGGAVGVVVFSPAAAINIPTAAPYIVFAAGGAALNNNMHNIARY